MLERNVESTRSRMREKRERGWGENSTEGSIEGLDKEWEMEIYFKPFIVVKSLCSWFTYLKVNIKSPGKNTRASVRINF